MENTASPAPGGQAGITDPTPPILLPFAPINAPTILEIFRTVLCNIPPLGQAAADCWIAIPQHFPFVVLDGFVIMPNHVHGIIIIDKPENGAGVQMQNDAIVQTQNFASLSHHPQYPGNKFGPQSQNLASIVRGYKIGVTKFARQNNIPFTWQARYHDHVIRNDAEYVRIAQYIEQNPQKWAEDKFYTNMG